MIDSLRKVAGFSLHEIGEILKEFPHGGWGGLSRRQLRRRDTKIESFLNLNCE
jgi:hypothetical protein